ncbi:MAG: long-chain fatty acid--CoA ligase [Planctomycetota bacterium]|nr:MAG: long-chain fatty acid--CoA ligase [Planctomycetota bacterium]
MSIHGPILRRLISAPWRTVAVDDRRSWRAGAMLTAAVNLADELSGVNRSDTLGVMLPTGGAFPVAALAGWMLGKTIVPLNYLLAREELEYVIHHSGADTVVTAGPLLEHMKHEPAGARLVRLETLPLARFPAPVRPRGADDGDLAAILYTSGTEGRPKGVMLTHGNLRANIRQIQQWIHFTRRDSLFGVLPQFHSFGFTVLTLLPLSVGCGVAYEARFTPARIVRRLAERRPTVLVAIPSMYNALLSVKDATPADFASLRLLVSGGEPLPRPLFERFRERFGKEIQEGYGLTETAPVTNWLRPGNGPFGTVGLPLPEIEERIVDLDTGRALPPNRDGEVRIKGPNVMKGYFRDPDATREAFDDDGFFRTGDIGRLDARGRLAITGREKEMIIVGGENVFPREIEDVLGRHESVGACGVIGVADPMRGEEPVAFVEVEDGRAFDERALRAFCRSNLASYKVPRRIHAVDALPKGPTGKVLRRALRDLLPDAGPAADLNAQERTRTSTP